MKLAELSKDHKYNFQYVETSVAGHRKQFKTSNRESIASEYMYQIKSKLHQIVVFQTFLLTTDSLKTFQCETYHVCARFRGERIH